MASASPDQLIEGLLQHEWDSEENGYLLNNLLDEFYRGFPISEILRLLESSDEKSIRAGTWIVSELGTKSCPIFRKIKPLIKSPDPKTRFHVASCILVCADEDDGESIIDLARLLQDKSSFVRWRAIDVLCRLSKRQISIVLNCTQSNSSKINFHHGFKLLFNCDNGLVSVEQIKAEMQNQDSLMQKFTIIAAVRQQLNYSIIQELSKISADPDIVDFCSDLEVSDYKPG